MRTLILVMLLSWSANGGPRAGALTPDEYEVYSAALRVMRTGAIDTVWVGERQLLARESTIARSHKHVSVDEMPFLYRSAFSDLVKRVGQEYRTDLSPLGRKGVLLADSMRFESGACTIMLSAIGFDIHKQTAAVMVTSGCRDVPGAFEGEILLCLTRTQKGWQATDYTVVERSALSALKEIARLFAGNDKHEANIYKGFAENEFVLGSKNRLIVEAPDELKEYEGGDRIRVRWEDGILFINGMQVRPPIEVPRKLRTIDRIKRSCGHCPIVIRYVEEHQGTGAEIEIWNKAEDLWYERVEALYEYVMERYPNLLIGDVGMGLPPLDPDRAAAAVAQDIGRQTDLVESAAIDPVVVTSECFGVMKEKFLSVRLWGRDEVEKIPLTPDVPGLRPEPGLRLVPKSEFDSWCRQFEWMTRHGRKQTVKILRGGIGIGGD